MHAWIDGCNVMQRKWCVASGNFTCSCATSRTSCCHIFEQLEIGCGGDLSVRLHHFISFITSNQLVVQVAYLASSPHAWFPRRLKIRTSIITILLIFPIPVPAQGILAKKIFPAYICTASPQEKSHLVFRSSSASYGPC